MAILRNTAYQFISTDSDALEEYMVSIYEAMTSTTVDPASPEMLFIKFVATLLLFERNNFNQAANQSLPSRATDGDLDELGQVFYFMNRPTATAASCTMRFYISEAQSYPVLIPGGTRVTDVSRTYYWAVPEDVYVPAGDLYIDTTVECDTAGDVGNDWEAGTINTIVDVYDFYTSCENITDSDGGADAPDDDEFYELMRLSLDALSTAGAKGAYEYMVKAVSTDIADVVANTPNPGEVRVYALMSDGTVATEEMRNRIHSSLYEDMVRPLTDYVVVGTPDEVHYDIDLTYYIPSNATLSASEIAANVEAAVEEYRLWVATKLGRDINDSKLIDLLMHTGAKRVVLRSPVYTQLRDGVLELDKEYELADTIPQVGLCDTDSGDTITIVNGGVEDE